MKDGTYGWTRAIHIERLFRSGTVTVARWRCLAGDGDSRAGLLQHDALVSFVDHGSFVVHARGLKQLIDVTRPMIVPARTELEMSKHYGVARGCGFSIDAAALRELAPSLDGDGVTALRQGEVTSRLYLLKHVVQRAVTGRADADPLEIEESVLALVAAITATRHAPCVLRHRKATRDLVEAAKAVLAKNFERAIHLDDVAHALDVSPFHLCRLFRRETGMPMHRYLTRLRLRASLDAVAEPNASLADVAVTVGFSSQSHFASAFRHEFALTPRAVRQIASRAQLRELRRALSF